MDMGGGRLIRVMILVLVIVLIWKVWDYSSLPVLEPLSFDLIKPEGKENSEDVLGTSTHKEEEQKAVLQAPGNIQQDDQLAVQAASTMRVEVYYEVLCPDSRHFVMFQLTPAYQKLKDVMSVALVPYGKAETKERGGKLTFECQHGPRECEGNKVHACVVSLVKDEAKQLAIAHCMIDRNEQPFKQGQMCVEKHGEAWAEIDKCARSEMGDDLLKHNGEMTQRLNPPVSFIPTITIDGSQADQRFILRDLHKVLCKRYKGPKPASC